jgi:hypothetical protein
MTRLRELATSKIRRPIRTTANTTRSLNTKMPPKSGKKGGAADKGKNAGEEERPDPLQALVCTSLRRAKKSAESCIDNNDDNIYEIELTHVRHRFWPTPSSPNLSLSHLSARDASCH